MKSYESFFRRAFAGLPMARAIWLLPIFVFMIVQCRLSSEEKGETYISFTNMYDSLRHYDNVVIELKNLNGDLLDVVFEGKVEQVGDLQKLSAPHWDGGRVIVSITGKKDGVIAYQVETRFDPGNGTRDNIVVFAAPDVRISSSVKGLTMYVGESLPLPPITLLPENLNDKNLDWASNPAGLVSFSSSSITGMQAGKGDVSVYLRNNHSIFLSIPVEVFPITVAPESVSVLPESLKVAAGGAEMLLTAQVSPSGAPAGVNWSSEDTSIARVDTSGRVKGIRKGETRVWAASRVKASIKGSASVKVSDPIPVEKVAFASDTLEINANGPAATLVVSVLPVGANPAVVFTLSDSTIASVLNGRISGTAPGRISVFASSVANPDAKDTLFVRINGPIAVETVAFAKDSIEILVGAAAESLIVSVLPAGANPAVTFTSSDTTKASIRNGKIFAKAAGRITVTAASVANPAIADNLIVRVVVPVPNDTIPPGKPTVSVKPAGPTQERKPVWTWKSGGGGAGAYQISLDKATFDSTAISLSDTTYTPAANLAAGLHVLYVRERDAANNWSPAGSAQVEIDFTGPSAPKLLGPAQTSSLPRWTWSTGGNGGAGLFRSRLGDALFPADAAGSADTVYALTAAASGTTYTLYVQERDAAGNWSSAASLPIKYDLTKPTVALTLPQASGTFITANDTVTIAGTVAGPNGIAKLEYVLDAGAATAITVATGGSWAIAALRVANAKTSTLKVTATDNLGNTGEAQLLILRDSDQPLPPTTLLKPSSPTNVALSAWAWSAGGDGAAGSGLSGKYRWKLNASATWTETNTASAPSVTLAEGNNTFSVQEQDKAGNWSEALTGTVVLDTKVPDAVTFIGVDGSYTSDDTPTWSWKPSTTNGGIGKYLVKLDAGAESDLDTATTYTPQTPLSDNATHTLTVKEKDQVPGVAGTAKTFSFKVKVNPPGAPVVKSAVATLPSNSLTNNPGFTWTSGGGGNGKYRVKVNTEATYRVNGVAQTTFSLSNSDADGTYIVYVSEQDDMGRYGTDGSFTIKLDRTAPVFANAKIQGKSYLVRDGYITNASSVIINYTADGVAKQLSCNLTDKAATLCSGAAITDGAGNSATYKVNIHRNSDVIFFQPGGTGDGSSWEDAAGQDIQAMVDQGASDGKDFWLASGDYTGLNPSLTIWGKTINIYGGFFLANYPTSTAGRTKWGSILAHISFMGSNGRFDAIKFDSPTGMGLGLGALGTEDSPANFVDCQFKDGFETPLGSHLVFTNCEMSGVSNGYIPANFSSGTIVWNGGQIVNNTPGSSYYAIEIQSGTSVTFKGVTISGNKPSFVSYQMRVYGTAVIGTGVTMPCSDITWEDGSTGSCGGVNH